MVSTLFVSKLTAMFQARSVTLVMLVQLTVAAVPVAVVAVTSLRTEVSTPM